MARKFGGILFYGAANINLALAQQSAVVAGGYGWTRNALGDISLNNATLGAATTQFWAALADLKRPFFNFQYPGIFAVQPVSNELQEVFGTAAGGPGDPFSGGATAAQFEVPPKPWGIAVVDVFAVYSVQTAALTTATLGLSRVTYTENAAFTNTALIAATGIALTTTTGAATPHVQTVAATNPVVFEINNNSDLIIELLITTAATSAVRVYGMGAHVAACYD